MRYKSGMKLYASIVFLTLAAASQAPGAVADSAPNGFTSKLEFQVKASPAAVYGKLLHNVGEWWEPAHTFSGNSANLSIEEKVMGCFCEKLPGGGMVRHLEVVYLDPAKALVFSGALGPMQSMGVTGSLAIRLTPAESGTRLEVQYAVGGYRPQGLDTMAAVVDGVLLAQFTHLKNLVETGKP